MPGRHNLQNALAAVAVGLELGLSFERIADGLREFRGVERRFEVRGEPNDILVVDDYSHHPTEIAAALAAARGPQAAADRGVPTASVHPDRLVDGGVRAGAGRRRSHRPDRHLRRRRGPDRRDHARGAGRRRSDAAPAPRSTSCRWSAIVVAAIVRLARPGDVVMTLGAGSIGGVPELLIEALAKSAPPAAGAKGGAVSPIAVPADKRFRRAHVKPGRPRRNWRRSRRRTIRCGLAIAAVLLFGIYRGTDLAAQAHVLQIERIVVQGNEHLSTGEVLAVLGGLRGQNLIWCDLDGWRQRLLSSPWVRDADLRRSLPSTVEVVVSERRPIGIGRIAGQMYLVDERGAIIDEFGPQYTEFDLPIIDGLTGSQATTARSPTGSGRIWRRA